jgi:AraC-like DNA-binding protein
MSTVIDESVHALPAPPLRKVIAAYDGYRQRGVPPTVHRGLPSPYMTLIITLYEPLRIVGHLDPRRPPAEYDTLVGGLHTTPAVIEHDGAQSGIQLRLSPLGARTLLRLPAAELAEQDVPASDVLGPVIDRLRDQLAEATGWPERFAILDRELTARITDSPEPPPTVANAWNLIRQTGGQTTIERVAREVGWSQRQLSKRFGDELGLTPKQAARVVRFDRARRALQAEPDQAIAAAAAHAGYADQSHLDREFREFAGMPPSHWLREEFRNVQAGAPQPDLGWAP